VTARPEHPTRIGKYRIDQVLGEGAMGVVYRAHDPAIEREVAIKTIRRELLASEGAAAMVERFRREAIAAGRLSHPGIVAVYDYGEDDGTTFIVMEYAPGESLDEHVQRRGGLPLGEIGSVMAQLLDALGYAHERGVVHRDVKPSNLLVLAGGKIKVTDFGIARIASSSLTHPGVAMGTPTYMAPEQYSGGAVDHRVDLFAAGVVLYQLVTGALPFMADTISALGYQVVHVDPPPPSTRNPSLPARLDAVVARALAKRADARYGAAADFARELAQVLGGASAADAVGETAFATTMVGGVPPTPPRGTAFDTETLRRLESTLAGIVGPLSGVVVRRAATRAQTAEQLVDAIAQSASSPAERARITEAARRIVGGATASAPVPIRSSEPPPATAPGVTQVDIDRATTELAKYVGPIARMLVKKALARASDVRSLCAILGEGIDREADRAKFLKAMGVAD
jgi:serine/threonine-protein kinase